MLVPVAGLSVGKACRYRRETNDDATMTETQQISSEAAAAGHAARSDATGLVAGLKRNAPRIITVLLFLAGAWALYHLLEPLDLRTVLHQVLNTPPHLVAGALLATVASYASLICYDWSALRYLGKTAPASSVALGGFLGYALGNTIGR